MERKDTPRPAQGFHCIAIIIADTTTSIFDARPPLRPIYQWLDDPGSFKDSICFSPGKGAENGQGPSRGISEFPCTIPFSMYLPQKEQDEKEAIGSMSSAPMVRWWWTWNEDDNIDTKKYVEEFKNLRSTPHLQPDVLVICMPISILSKLSSCLPQETTDFHAVQEWYVDTAVVKLPDCKIFSLLARFWSPTIAQQLDVAWEYLACQSFPLPYRWAINAWRTKSMGSAVLSNEPFSPDKLKESIDRAISSPFPSRRKPEWREEKDSMLNLAPVEAPFVIPKSDFPLVTPISQLEAWPLAKYIEECIRAGMDRVRSRTL